MEYRQLGSTGLEVSIVGFGAEWIAGMNQDQVNELTRACEEGGVNIVDCWMADPTVRARLGNALKPNRDKWIIQGHIGSVWDDGQYIRCRQMDKVRKAFDDQLELLQTDHVELGMIHFVDDADEYDGIMSGEFLEYVMGLKKAGRIQHIGISTHNPIIALKAANSGIIESIMFSVNPAFDLFPAIEDLGQMFADEYDEGLAGMDPVRAEIYATCERNGVGITVMKGFAGGRLLDSEKSPFGCALTPAQCIHYALNRPAVSAFMGGYQSVRELNDALAYCDATAEELDYATILAQAPKHAYYGKCVYCGHCQPCAAHIDIAMVNKYYDLATMQEEIPESIRSHYFGLDKTAADCIGCGQCEPNCPFGVHIANRMEMASALFGNG